MSFRPQLEMVKSWIGSKRSGRVIMPPEKTSRKISTTGMIVMAVVVVRAKAETNSASMSAA